MTDRELFEQALEALETVFMPHHPAAIALRERLARQEQEPVGQLQEEAYGRGQVLWFNKPADQTMLYTAPQPAQQPPQFPTALRKMWSGAEVQQWINEHWTQPAQHPLTDEQAYDMGAKGGAPTENERLLFEAWMRGHCWKVEGDWNGNTYVHAAEKRGDVHGGAMRTRCLWAAWRDRAALAAHGITGEKK